MSFRHRKTVIPNEKLSFRRRKESFRMKNCHSDEGRNPHHSPDGEGGQVFFQKTCGWSFERCRNRKQSFLFAFKFGMTRDWVKEHRHSDEGRNPHHSPIGEGDLSRDADLRQHDMDCLPQIDGKTSFRTCFGISSKDAELNSA